MTKFYLNNVEVFVELAPSETQTQDETSDSAKVILEANDVSTPIAPMQSFKIEHEDGTFDYFVTVSDQVELFSTYPLTYKHTLTVAQNTRIFSKHILRNTVFSQVANNKRSGYVADVRPIAGTPYVITPYKTNIFLDYKDKVYKARVLPRYQEYFGYYNNVEAQWHSTIIQPSFSTKVFVDYNLTIKNLNTNEIKVIFAGASGKQNGQWFELNDELSTWLNAQAKPCEFELTHIATTTFTVINTTLSYTSSIELELELANQTMWDVLDTLRKQMALDTTQYVHTKLYEMPLETSDFGKLLKSTIAPNFAFTQSNLFDALFEIYKFFDGIMTLDADNRLGIEYFNDFGERITDLKLSGMVKSIGEEKYNNGLISYYQNALFDIAFPDKKTDSLQRKSFAPIKSVVLGVPNKNDFALMLPHDIEIITKVEIKCKPKIYVTNNKNDFVTVDDFITIDITENVFESSLWSLLNSTNTFPYNNDFTSKVQNCVLSYTKGSRELNVSGGYKGEFGQYYDNLTNVILCGVARNFGIKLRGSPDLYMASSVGYPSSQNWKEVFIRVEYIARADGRTEIQSLTNKYNGSMIVNQNNGIIDIKKLGINMLGIALKIGEPTFSVTHEITNWNDRLRKGQYYIDENNERWVINSITYTILNNGHFQGNIEFVKNFNAISQFVGLNHEKRLSNISNALAIKSEDNYIEYVYFTTGSPTQYSKQFITFGYPFLLDQLVNTFGVSPNDTARMLDIVYINTYYENDAHITTSGGDNPNNDLFIPLFKYGTGNCINFEIAFNSPIVAGRKLDVKTGWFGSDKYFSKDVFYTDANGWFDKIDINFCSALFSYNYADDLPQVNTSSLEVVGTLGKLKYYKKPNEIFALNYELCFLPTPNRENIDFVSPLFINENAMIIGIREKRTLKLFYELTDDFKYSVLDIEGHGTNIKTITAISVVNQVDYIECTIDTSSIAIPIKAWALCDSQNKIILSSNQETAVGSVKFYFLTRHTRL